MCQFDEGFILCTCVDPKPVVHNKHSRQHKNKQTEGLQRRYLWILNRYLRYEDNGMIGLCFMPETNIGDGLTDV